MKKNKIYLIITPFFPTPKSFRGPFVYDQVRAIMRNSDYRVLVFVPTSVFHPEDDYEYEGIHVYRFKTLNMPSNIFNGLTNSYNTSSFIKKIKELGFDIKDIAVAHGHTTMFAAYSLAVKKLNPNVLTVVQHHDPDPFGLRNGRLATWGINARYKAAKALALFKRIDIHLCVSKYVESNLKNFPGHSSHDTEIKYLNVLKLVHKFKPFVPKRTIVLHNGVDTDIFYPDPKKHDKFTIGCIANIVDWKSQITLLKAVNILYKEGDEDLKVIMIGSGPLEKECREYIKDNGMESIVEIRKEVHHKNLPSIFNTFDIFILPSYFEGFGCVFTEASACGVPFITCEGQGATEYISEDEMDKWTIKPLDYKDLSDKIKKYKKNRCPQKIIRSYDINTLIKSYLTELEASIDC